MKMRKKRWGHIGIIISILMLCMVIPAEALKADTAGQSDQPYTDTKLTKKEQKKFFRQYKKYGISEKNGILYYKDKPVRCFADIYRVVRIEHSAKINGTVITCESAYRYFNENGIVDVYTERTKNTKNGSSSYGKIIKRGTALEKFIFVMPEVIIKKMAEQLNKEGAYKKLVKIACFIDKNTIGKVAKGMVEKGNYKELLDIACFVDKKDIGEVAKKIAEKGNYKELLDIACFVDKKDIGEIAKEMAEKGNYKEVINLAWCIDQDVMDEIAEKAAQKKKYKEVVALAYYVSKDVLGEIAKKMAEDKEYEILKEIAWYIA